jgi:hypothetical protein
MAGFVAWNNVAPLAIGGVVTIGWAGPITAAFDASYPASYCLTPAPAKFTRVIVSPNGASSGTFLRILARWSTTAEDRPIRMVGAVIRIPTTIPGLAFSSELLNTAGVTLAVSTGYKAAFLAADLVPLPGTPTGWFFMPFPYAATTNSSSASIAITSSANYSATIDLGLLWASDALHLPDGFGAGWNRGVVDPTPVVPGKRGEINAYRLPRRRWMSGPILVGDPNYNRALGTPGTVATPNLRAITDEVGTSAPVVVVARDDTAHSRQVLGMYGKFTEIPVIADGGGNTFNANYRVEEIR